MKLLKMLCLVLLGLFAFAAAGAQTTTDTIKVYGNCGMCKKRIENAIKSDVRSARWDAETGLLTVTYDPSKTTSQKIQQRVAAVGHDTEGYRAEDKLYQKLPGCCQYERKEKDKGASSGHQHH